MWPTSLTRKNVPRSVVPGLERAIPKKQGIEYASLLHQIAADLVASPFSPQIRAILLEINPEGKDRLPKRQSKKKKVEPPKEPTKTPPEKNSGHRYGEVTQSRPAQNQKASGKKTDSTQKENHHQKNCVAQSRQEKGGYQEKVTQQTTGQTQASLNANLANSE